MTRSEEIKIENGINRLDKLLSLGKQIETLQVNGNLKIALRDSRKGIIVEADSLKRLLVLLNDC